MSMTAMIYAHTRPTRGGETDGDTDRTTELTAPAVEKPARRPRPSREGDPVSAGRRVVGAVLRPRTPERERAEVDEPARGARLPQRPVGRAAEGRPLPPRVDKIGYAELAADLRLHYQTTNHRDAKDVERRLRPLDAFFAGWRVVDLDEAAITRYVARRQASVSRRGGRPRTGRSTGSCRCSGRCSGSAPRPPEGAAAADDRAAQGSGAPGGVFRDRRSLRRCAGCSGRISSSRWISPIPTAGASGMKC